ncbi:MAG: tRNA (5-methylaminomethyl-2-thiouridine)(34)-methyltransferase MnmD [Balneolaceae bacterium]|nr:tRNA (5-methylaminomethyl-2-thiouridine)(34)-methyltransferase MnmD [Balneolaceae bacterium]
MEPQIRETKDGSSTLFSSQFDQHYHNPNGAVAESRHVFFETTGLSRELASENALTIFETGFGTGLNLLLCLDYLHKSSRKTPVTFKSIEAYPIAPETAEKLTFGDEPFLNQQVPLLANIFDQLTPGINHFEISPLLQLELFYGYFDEYPGFSTVSEADNTGCHFILHDPFSPEVNPELWTPDVFKKLFSVSSPQAVIATYCAATSARAAMAVAGWNVARAKGALGKREMTVASKSADKLSLFKRVNEKRLKERFEKGDFS